MTLKNIKQTGERSKIPFKPVEQSVSGDKLRNNEFLSEIPFLIEKKECKSSNVVAIKVVITFLLLSMGLGLLFSEAVGLKLILSSPFYPFKYWIIILFIALCLFWQIKIVTNSLHHRYELLEKNESRLARLNRGYVILRHIDQILLQKQDPEQLLLEVCNIIYKFGDYAFVWAGLCEPNENLPSILASQGSAKKYLQDLFNSYASPSLKERQEPSLSALRNKQTVIINDVSTFSKKQLNWQKRMLENGFLSIAAFVLSTNKGRDGVLVLYSKQVNAFAQEEVKLFSAMVQDINIGLSAVEQKDQRYYLASYDVDVDLPNLALFKDRLSQAIARAQKENEYLCVAVVKITNLSGIVEQFGQEAGSNVVRETGSHLMRLISSSDTVASIGKNNIALMLTDITSKNDLPFMLNRLLNSFIFHNEKNEVEISMHAGISVYPDDAQDALLLIEYANKALESSTFLGELNCNFYSKKRTLEIRNRERIRSELPKAVEKGEFVLYYQPIHELVSKEVVGIEVLTRWPHQKLGEVSPIQFFPIARELGLSSFLENWIVKTACLQMMQWHQMGVKLFLSINISIYQLEDPQFAEKLTKLLNEIHFSLKEMQLCLEVSERVLVKEHEHVRANFIKLRKMGIKISIDDYGAQSSSISDLLKLPFDTIKIDTMLIRAIGKNENSDLIIKGMIALLKGLNVQLIAEGVETEDQQELLKQYGCTLAQGYLFSSPQIAKNVVTLFNNPTESSG
ncbi:MAG: EAL domain-containing protein [Proteobacteria bacterium]|nr:EAL domain-containing protein [Pseudomonadota bacterium]